jgi:hypothetical protein
MTVIRRTCTLATLALTLCAAAVQADERSLYQRLGGYDASAAASDGYTARLATDEQERRFFTGFSTNSKMRIRQLGRPAVPATISVAT